MLIQNEWSIDTLIKAYEGVGMMLEINDGEITGITFEEGEDD